MLRRAIIVAHLFIAHLKQRSPIYESERLARTNPKTNCPEAHSAQAAPILKALTNAIRKSVVLMELHHSIRFARGRFYLERMFNYGVSNEVEVVARVTPLSDPPGVLLLESGGGNHWHTIKKGKPVTISKTLTQQGAEIFYGLGALDASLREDMKSHFKNQPEIDRDKNEFRYRKTGEPCSVQEALFYYFGLLIDVIAEPADWYAYGRYPVIAEVSDDELAILVRFSAETIGGSTFGGTCLYVFREEQWRVYKIRPNQSATITSALQWLEKRKWQGW